MEQDRDSRKRSTHLDVNLTYERTSIVNQWQKMNLSLKYAGTTDDPYAKKMYIFNPINNQFQMDQVLKLEKQQFKTLKEAIGKCIYHFRVINSF